MKLTKRKKRSIQTDFFHGPTKIPFIEKLPVKGPPGPFVLGPVLEIVEVNYVNEWAHRSPVVRCNRV